jgi:cell division protein YceG involved in septum cleavage
MAWQSFGAPGPSLNSWQRFSYALDLVWNAGDLTQPRDPGGAAQVFVIQPGESVRSISDRLEQAGLIRNAQTFRTYLLWTGLDTIIQTGTYRLSPAQTGRDIAQMLKSTTLTEVTFSVLPGWRLEEIAASLPTSGWILPQQPFWRLPPLLPTPPTFLPPARLPKASFPRQIYPAAYHLSRTTGLPAAAKFFLQVDP